MEYKYYASSATCSGTPTVDSGSYPYGCITVASGTSYVSTNQLNCPGGPDRNYYVYLEGWLEYVGQNWVVPNFDATKQPCYTGHGTFSVSGNSVSVSVNIAQCTDTQISAFVSVVCNDFATAANAGTCTNANCGTVNPVTAKCAWSFQTKRDAQQGTSILLSSTLNAPGSAASLMFPLLVLLLSALVSIA